MRRLSDHISAQMRTDVQPGLVEVWYPYPAVNTYWHEACRTLWFWICRDFKGADLVIVHGS